MTMSHIPNSFRSLRALVAGITLMTALSVSLPAFSQVRWGATAGVMLDNLHFKQKIVDVKSVPGASAGVLGEIIFPGVGFGMDFGAQYELRGASVHLGDKPMWQSKGYGDTRFYMHYLDIPIHLRFKYTRLGGLEDTFAPFVYAGPAIGLQLGHSNIKAFDFPFGEVGLDMGLGAELNKRWQVSASFNLGMTYATKAKLLTDYSAQNRGLKLSVVYFFKKK